MTQHSWALIPEKEKTYVHTDTCTWMFIAGLLVSATDGKQSRYPSSGKQLNCNNPDQKILPSHKKEPTIDTHNLDEHPKNYEEWKKTAPKVYILCDSILEMTEL